MFYRERINNYLKFFCLDIGKFQSMGRCFQVCGNILDMFILISYNMEIDICMCCDDIIESDIISLNWKI